MANLLEEEIVNKIGMNETLEKDFSDELEVVENDKEISYALAFYTYEGNVYILDSNGKDIPFDDYEEESQKLIYNTIMLDDYE